MVGALTSTVSGDSDQPQVLWRVFPRDSAQGSQGASRVLRRRGRRPPPSRPGGPNLHVADALFYFFQKSNQIADFVLFYRKVNKNQVENVG